MTGQPDTPRPAPPDGTARHYTFLLLDRFSLLSFAGAVDCLRLANRIAGRPLYAWSLTADGGGPAASSAGLAFAVDDDLGDPPRGSTILVCGGLDVGRATSRRVVAWLRRVARNGGDIGALCTATHALATAGLLDDRQATIHWENMEGFAEAFDEIELTRRVFTIDGNRMTTAGGTASIDLMLRLVARDQGEELANAVADQLVYSSIRTDQDQQRLSIPTRIGVRHPKLSTVIQRMEAHIEEPISPAILARQVGLSTRQLERLFRRYLNRSPKRYYMELRLERARKLLMQTDMSVINVGLACGFTSPSHFSKCYRSHYDTTPYRERGSHARA